MKKVVLVGIILLTILTGTLLVEASICCEKKLNGAWCQEVESETECDTQYEFSLASCEQTNFCKTGCCYDSLNGVCSDSSVEKQCTNLGGKWSGSCSENRMCEEGCCKLDRNTEWLTRGECLIKSEGVNREMDFDSSISEEECVYSSSEDGACISEDGSCRRTSEQECTSSSGDFRKGYLCSKFYPDETGCKPQDHLGCSEDKAKYPDVFWYDSCNQRENIYEGNQNKKSSYNDGKIKPKEEVKCDPVVNVGCGKCDYEGGESICSEKDGNFYCKDMTCKDKYDGDKIRKHGESWCVFETPVGKDPYENQEVIESGGNGYTAPLGKIRDPVGADHWLRYCEDGNIKTSRCGVARSEICQETTTKGIPTLSQAQCRINNGWMCAGYKSEEQCLSNSDCMVLPTRESEGKINSVNVDSQFRFDVCVARFPIGIAGIEGESSEIAPPESEEETTELGYADICNRASKHCHMVYTAPPSEIDPLDTTPGYGGSGGGLNADCQSQEFLMEMDEFCTSMGDCGGFVNTAGNYSASYKIKNSEDKSLEKYFTEYPKEKIGVGENTPEWGLGEPGLWITQETIQPFLFNEDIKSSGAQTYFRCYQWEAPMDGNCELCNEDAKTKGIPCTTYKCQSLGQKCIIANPDSAGTSIDEKICMSTSCKPEDPGISEGKLIEKEKFEFKKINTGVQIVEKGKDKITEFTPGVVFTLKTEILSECKYSTDSQVADWDFDDTEKMIPTKEIGQLKKEHTFEMPALPAYTDPTVSEDHVYRIYVLCRTVCEGFNTNNLYRVEFPLEQLPDSIAPKITDEPIEKSYIPFGKEESILKILGNEPLKECRYSVREGTGYNEMEETFEGCNYGEKNPEEWYCDSVIKNLINPESKIYVKCQDLEGNSNSGDLVHTFIKSSSKLIISSFSPENGTVRKDWVNVSQPVSLSVTTEGGIDSGNSNCTWNVVGLGVPTGFLEEESTVHTASITGGINTPKIYTIKFRCEDKAGNIAENETELVREIDLTPPKVVRVIKEGTSVKFTTDEEAMCYYANSTEGNCGFLIDKGIPIDTLYNFDHTFTKKDLISIYYIKCIDLYQNENSNCAVIIRPTN